MERCSAGSNATSPTTDGLGEDLSAGVLQGAAGIVGAIPILYHFHATTKPTAPCHSPVVRFSHHRPGTPLWPGSATHRKMRWVNPATDDDFVAWSFSLQLAQKMRSHFRCVHWSVFRAPDLLLPVRLLAPCRHPQRYDWNHGFRAAPVVVAAGHPAYVIGSGRSKQASKNTCWRTHRLQHHSLHLC
jgi:hypothetical protein